MADHAKSSNPGVQAQLDRLWSLSPGADILGLARITRLLARLGNPERRLPPVFHVAGTNGKGSTCAFLRAALEAAGHRVHVYSSPHLVRFNERIRLAGRLIDDDALATLLAEVLDQADGIGASFFEVTTAAAFLAFARTPADACIIEVGLGGRLDATNVVTPVVTGIAALGIDHQAFLGDTLIAIAAEKAGIAKPGISLVTMTYPADIAARIAEVAGAAFAPVAALGRDWSIGQNSRLTYEESDGYSVILSRPAMTGAFQSENYALAIAMLRRQQALAIPEDALRRAGDTAHWPARMQRLSPGPLVDRLPPEQRRFGVWVDGAHNVSAAERISGVYAQGAATALVIGMLANKDADGVLRHLLRTASDCTVVAVPVPGHACHDPYHLAGVARTHGVRVAFTAPSLPAAFDMLSAQGSSSSVLIAGSLYLAGEALAANDEHPA